MNKAARIAMWGLILGAGLILLVALHKKAYAVDTPDRIVKIKCFGGMARCPWGENIRLLISENNSWLKIKAGKEIVGETGIDQVDVKILRAREFINDNPWEDD